MSENSSVIAYAHNAVQMSIGDKRVNLVRVSYTLEMILWKPDALAVIGGCGAV